MVADKPEAQIAAPPPAGADLGKSAHLTSQDNVILASMRTASASEKGLPVITVSNNFDGLGKPGAEAPRAVPPQPEQGPAGQPKPEPDKATKPANDSPPKGFSPGGPPTDAIPVPEEPSRNLAPESRFNQPNGPRDSHDQPEVENHPHKGTPSPGLRREN